MVGLAVVLAFGVAGCGGGSEDETNGSGSNTDNGGVSNVSSEKATQKSISFSAESYNLDWSADGTTAAVTVRVSDTAGNPLPTGTKIQFSASGGQIEKTCSTGSGTAGATGCSVNFYTQNPRPADGIVSIVAWMVGEESYKDLNGNGKYDAGEPFYESGTLFRDDDMSQGYTASVDELVVGTSIEERKIGVGTSACRQDTAAAPTEIPLSVPNTCDGVWGKTLIRAQAYFAVSDPRRLGVEQAEDVGGSALPNVVSVFSYSPSGNAKVAAPSGTVLTVEGLASGCTANFTPNATVDAVSYLPTQHTIVLTGGSCPTSGSVQVKATSGSYSQYASISVGP